MASSSCCVYDNRYLLIAGFNQSQHFFAEPPVFTDDWEPIRGITDGEPYLLNIAWESFRSAYVAALATFSEGRRIPRKALRILSEAQSRYEASEPPPNVSVLDPWTEVDVEGESDP